MRLQDKSFGSTSPRFSRQAEGGLLILTHDDLGIRATDEVAAMVRAFTPFALRRMLSLKAVALYDKLMAMSN